MCYKISKLGDLSDANGQGHLQLRFLFQETDRTTWGANLSGSPALAHEDDEEQETVFFIVLKSLPDRTPGSTDGE